MKKFLFVLALIVATFAMTDVMAQQIPKLELYHGETCPHCHRAKAWFPELLKAYPDLKIEEYEVWNNAENNQKFRDRMTELGKEASGVPTMIIQDNVVSGFNEKIAQKILDLMQEYYGPPAVEIQLKTDEPKAEAPTSLWQKILNFFKRMFS